MFKRSKKSLEKRMSEIEGAIESQKEEVAQCSRTLKQHLCLHTELTFKVEMMFRHPYRSECACCGKTIARYGTHKEFTRAKAEYAQKELDRLYPPDTGGDPVVPQGDKPAKGE